MIHNFASFKYSILKKGIKNAIIKWHIAVENEIFNVNGTVIIQSYARAQSGPVIWGQQVFGARLYLHTAASDLSDCVKRTGPRSQFKQH